MTYLAASGSASTLKVATGVGFPVRREPPMNTTRRISPRASGCFCSSRAILVSGARAMMSMGALSARSIR